VGEDFREQIKYLEKINLKYEQFVDSLEIIEGNYTYDEFM